MYWYSLREVYYDRSNNMYAWSADPEYPSGVSTDETLSIIELMLLAFRKPVVEVSPKNENLLVETDEVIDQDKLKALLQRLKY